MVVPYGSNASSNGHHGSTLNRFQVFLYSQLNAQTLQVNHVILIYCFEVDCQNALHISCKDNVINCHPLCPFFQ